MLDARCLMLDALSDPCSGLAQVQALLHVPGFLSPGSQALSQPGMPPGSRVPVSCLCSVSCVSRLQALLCLAPGLCPGSWAQAHVSSSQAPGSVCALSACRLVLSGQAVCVSAQAPGFQAQVPGSHVSSFELSGLHLCPPAQALFSQAPIAFVQAAPLTLRTVPQFLSVLGSQISAPGSQLPGSGLQDRLTCALCFLCPRPVFHSRPRICAVPRFQACAPRLQVPGSGSVFLCPGLGSVPRLPGSQAPVSPRFCAPGSPGSCPGLCVLPGSSLQDLVPGPRPVLCASVLCAPGSRVLCPCVLARACVSRLLCPRALCLSQNHTLHTTTPPHAIKHATGNMQHSTCNMQHATTCHAPHHKHATCNMQHVTCDYAQCHIPCNIATCYITTFAIFYKC
jgi:hypothetical protein